MLQLLAYMVLLGEVHMFLELSWIGLFGANIDYVHPETPQLQEVLLSNSNTILTGIQCAVAPASNMNGFLSEIHVFLQLSWIGLFGTKLAYLQYEVVICSVYYSKNLTQFSQENKALNGQFLK
jgi:predicted small integral membrane protein